MKKYVLFMLALTIAPPALAQIEVRECGAPPPAELNTNPAGHYCNHYSRQLAYAEEDRKFRSLLKERQENYAAPYNRVQAEHRETMRDHYGYADSRQQETESEIFGPESNQQ